MNIFDLWSAKAIAAYWEEVYSNQIPMLGATLFPNKRMAGLTLAWIKGNKGLPIALMPSAFDTNVTIRDRIGVTTIKTKMPFFREAMRIGEEERQNLLQYAANANSPYAQAILQHIYDDTAELVEGANVQAERMRMSLLVNGKISIKAPNDKGMVVDYDYNYDVDGSWATANTGVLTGTDMWSNLDTSNPVRDILEYQKIANKRGIVLSRCIMTTVTWGYLLQNKALRNDMIALNSDAKILTDSDMHTYLLRKLGLTVQVYDKGFKDEAGVEHDYYPDNFVTFLPSTTLGSTYYGTTPEEADLMSGQTPAQVSIVGGGIAVTTNKVVGPPINVETWVSAIALPSFERMDEVFVLQVAA